MFYNCVNVYKYLRKIPFHTDLYLFLKAGYMAPFCA